MKVCKVVINSVTHDARVLKEAEAIREMGHDVVVLGIQDANVNTPIEKLDNGVVVRRAAWQSEAVRPSRAVYFAKFAGVVGGLLAVYLLALLAVRNYSHVAGLFTPERFVVTIALFGLLASAFFLWRSYHTRRKVYLNLRRQENVGLLKYDKELSACRISTGSRAPNLSTPSQQEDAAQRNRTPRGESIARSLARLCNKATPRPLMGSAKARLFAPLNMRRWKNVFAREHELWNLLEAEAPDVVHAHDLAALPLAAKYAKTHRATLVFDAHEVYDHLAQSEDEMAELNSHVLRKYSDAVDRFITINESIAGYYRSNYASLPPATVVKNAAKPAEPVAYDGRLHKAAGLAPDARIIIYQGGFASKRGLIQLLMAAEYLHSEWAIVYMGWGNLEEQLREVADALILKNPSMSEKIRFVPKVKQDELPYWTAGATIGAIPYENTGLNHWFCNPNKLWEYPNAGVPILASPFPEMRAIIDKYQLGWYLPDPLNPKLIADVINSLTDADLKTASSHCRAFIAADNWSIYSKRLKELYANLP